jgi:predicted small integral membrane protein
MKWLGPIIGATLIVVLAWTASLFQATAEIFVAASLAFSIGEGIILAFIGAAWSSRGAPTAVVVACITAVLATPGRWELAYLRTGVNPQMNDLLVDLGVTLAWAAFCGLAGATILRERLTTLMPRG